MLSTLKEKWPYRSLNAQYSSQVAQRRNLSKFLLSRRHPSQPNVHTIDWTEKVSEIQVLLLGVFSNNSSKKYGKFLGGTVTTDDLHHHCPLAVILNRDLKRIANWAKDWKVTLNPVESKAWYYKLCCLFQSTRFLRYQRTTLWWKGRLCVIWNCSMFFNFPAFSGIPNMACSVKL